MPDHLDSDELAEISLGPPDPARLTPYRRHHLRLCDRCRGELAELRAVVRAARDITSDDLLVEPPASVWESVVVRLHLDDEDA
ncbi:hypothetical protein OG897_29610 [Streptomyces sp. NBC_00237]|uniref:hypothetical protein n=1 Tax=Streptomyces sp. NBC_00237 TaxID=2975687 RepID=UPI0022528741|nr:hypothetical protein [Streptomyces sp. NBC_00237]MCX5205605.1 hypothetical protein [Streptomyces sp. NBC_00237]